MRACIGVAPVSGDLNSADGSLFCPEPFPLGRIWGGNHPQVEHSALAHVCHGLAVLDPPQTTQGEGDATGGVEYLESRLGDILSVRLLHDHFGAEHEWSEAVADFVNRCECRIPESGEPAIAKIDR